MIRDSDKKGLSTVVTTLIIILLVFVAIGIVWVVVRNVVTQGSTQIDVGAKCISSSVKATSVDCATPTACDVQLKRDLGNDDIGGVYLVFYDSLGNAGSPVAVSGDIATLGSKTASSINSGLTTPDKVEVTVYFLDDSGNEQLCSSPSTFSF